MSPQNRAHKLPNWAPGLMVIRRYPSIIAVLVIFGVLTGIGCSTTGPSPSEVAVPWQKIPDPQIQTKTILPPDFSDNFSSALGIDLVVIPRNLLSRSHISRPRADLRRGPGSEFELLDSTLEENDKAIIFDTIGVWSKIVSLRLGISGWVHRKVLADDFETGDNVIKVAVKLLPTVIAVESIGFVYSYGDLIKMPVLIKRGTQFIALRKFNGRTLVWLTKTNSVVWISDQSVK